MNSPMQSYTDKDSTRDDDTEGEDSEDYQHYTPEHRERTPSLAGREVNWDKLFRDFSELRHTLGTAAHPDSIRRYGTHSRQDLERMSDSGTTMIERSRTAATELKFTETKPRTGRVRMPYNAFLKVKVDGATMFQCNWTNSKGTCGKRFTRRSGNAKAHWQSHQKREGHNAGLVDYSPKPASG